MPWRKFSFWAHGIRFDIVHGRSPALPKRDSLSYRELGEPVRETWGAAPRICKFTAYRNGKWVWVATDLTKLKFVLNRIAIRELIGDERN